MSSRDGNWLNYVVWTTTEKPHVLTFRQDGSKMNELWMTWRIDSWRMNLQKKKKTFVSCFFSVKIMECHGLHGLWGVNTDQVFPDTPVGWPAAAGLGKTKAAKCFCPLMRLALFSGLDNDWNDAYLERTSSLRNGLEWVCGFWVTDFALIKERRWSRGAVALGG